MEIIRKRKPITWILVTDSKEGRVYSYAQMEKRVPLPGNALHHHYLESVETELVPVPSQRWWAERPEDFEIGRDAVGMVYESVGKARHMNEPHQDIHRAIREHLMQKIATHLNVAHERDLFQKLVLVAPPSCLGLLRKHLNTQTKKAVVQEVHKELAGCSGEALRTHLWNIVQPTVPAAPVVMGAQS